MPLVWDFDMCERTNDAWSRIHLEHMNQLFNNSNREFVDAYAGRWRKLENTLSNDFEQNLNNFTNTPEGSAVEFSFQLDKIVWGKNLSVYGIAIAHKNWINNRHAWMSTKLQAMNPQGDTNVDGTLSMDDLTVLINALLTSHADYPHACDVNRDNSINMDDLTYLINMLLTGN